MFSGWMSGYASFCRHSGVNVAITVPAPEHGEENGSAARFATEFGGMVVSGGGVVAPLDAGGDAVGSIGDMLALRRQEAADTAAMAKLLSNALM
jgi:hypothetical protein